MIRRISVTLPIFLLGACIGDSTMHVAGRIVDTQGIVNSGCSISLHLAKSDLEIDKSKVPGEFTEHFVVAPRPRTYYLVAECPAGKKWRSQQFRYPGENERGTLIDFGNIVVN
jgi:hypothetical protein